MEACFIKGNASTEEVAPKNRWRCLEGLTKRQGDTCLSQRRYMRFRERKEKREKQGGERGKKEKKEEGKKAGRSVLGRAGATSWEHRCDCRVWWGPT